MIEGLSAIAFNIAAIALISFIVSNMAVSVVVSVLAQKFVMLEVNSRKVSLWLLALIPWLAVSCVVICFSYQLHLATKLSLYAHWHHMNTFTLLSWHSVTLLVAMVLFCLILVNKLKGLVNHSRELALLRSMSTEVEKDVYEINTPQASAFTCGFFNKYCYVTRGILAQTSKQEQAVILGHEKAHARLNDPLKKWLFSILASFFVPQIATRLKLHMTLAMEQAADRAVIDNDTPATFVASTLVKVARLNQDGTEVCLRNNEFVTNFGADVLEQRVYFLLGQLDLEPANKLMTLTFTLLTLAACLMSIDGIHHLMETVFNH